MLRDGLHRNSYLVLIDDGLATKEVIRQLTAKYPVPLRRARQQQLSPPRRAAALATAISLRAALHAGRLTWVTALPAAAGKTEQRFLAAGGSIRRHEFSWLKSLPELEHRVPGRIVLGSAMVADGLIRRRDYVDWVSRVTAGSPSVYFAHRRELDSDLCQLDALDSVTVRRAGLPVELRLAHAPHSAEIFSLPTTAVATLPLVMDDPRITMTEIPRTWWTGHARDSLRRELNRTMTAPRYNDAVSKYTVVSVSDSESYLKWACRTLDALGPDIDAHVWLIDNPILPTPEQVTHATAGSSWEHREIPIVNRSELESELERVTPDIVLAAATGPVVQQIFATGAHLERRPALVSGLPGVGLPATSKGMRYRRIGDAFITHSEHERAEYLAVAQKLGIPVELIVARLPLLESTAPPQPQFPRGTPPERIVFATQAKVPVERADRIRILLSLTEYARRHPGCEVIIKVRSRPGEQETHHEEFTYISLLDQLIADGLIAKGELTVAVGAMSLFLTPGTALVTVSSTAALESIDRGLPTLIIDDFGVSREMLNIAFEESGVTGSLADMIDGRIGFPNRNWLVENYFQEPNCELTDSFELLALRSRERQLPDLRGAARVQDFRRLRAELRTKAPAQLVRGYRTAVKPLRRLVRFLNHR
ncbi:hypothetical protein GCM10022261_04760 [Brevibacterium daeguense]|uniref:Uncharacterized protein n=2 Tax=Brevibacterium daeguense TaxID=909936 RepID=A0ABP8EGG1_9MICO